LPRADEPLLFSSDGGKDERCVEVDAARGEHARKLHHQYDAAPVVIHAGRVSVVGGRAETSAAGSVQTRLPLRAKIDGVVVPTHVDAARRLSRQDRDDVAELDVAGDAATLRNLMRVETHLQ